MVYFPAAQIAEVRILMHVGPRYVEQVGRFIRHLMFSVDVFGSACAYLMGVHRSFTQFLRAITFHVYVTWGLEVLLYRRLSVAHRMA